MTQNNTKYILKAALFCLIFTMLLVTFPFFTNFVLNKFQRLSLGIIGTLTALLTTFFFLKFDKKHFSDIGLTFQRNTLLKFLIGVLVGIILMGLMVISILHFSGVNVYFNTRSNVWHFLFITLPILLMAFMEELAFRAYPLQILKDKIGIRSAIIITSLLFALYHISNGWSIAVAFYGPGVWGLFFGLSAIYSKGIAMSTGIHYAVNLTTSAFGASNNVDSIWIVKQSQNSTVTIFAAVVLLVFTLICIELYLRQKSNASKSLPVSLNKNSNHNK